MGVTISAPYIYVCTRMRIRKAKLLPKEEYMRMLNMSISEITRVISETEYKQEIDELGNTFKGIDLLEVALSWNLAKEYQRILEITPGMLKQFTRAYLRYWDIQNVLTILRGKSQGEKTGKIKEVLVPAGSLDKVVLDRLLAEDSADRVIEALKGKRLYPVLAREYPAAKETGSFARMENELYKQFYAEIIAEASGGDAGGRQFLAFIRLDIDVKNILTLFRLRVDKIQEDVKEMYIAGGTITAADFAALNTIKDYREFIDQLRVKVRTGPVLELLKDLETERPVHEIASLLVRVQMEQMEKLSKRNPFSIYPILVYLEKKKYEVFNLRALTRGKESKLPAETIGKYLVI
ncbi:MAG: V-type ATP synthase subunit C [Methanoregula sp.]|jgi:V/A-type H+-transporting ATPase subunit C|uniref:V-type ATP synthase subunit C n=1 Tax=Methanoregula sp. TaxID=2052170 RepID=UPI003D132EA8